MKFLNIIIMAMICLCSNLEAGLFFQNFEDSKKALDTNHLSSSTKKNINRLAKNVTDINTHHKIINSISDNIYNKIPYGQNNYMDTLDTKLNIQSPRSNLERHKNIRENSYFLKKHVGHMRDKLGNLEKNLNHLIKNTEFEDLKIEIESFIRIVENNAKDLRGKKRRIFNEKVVQPKIEMFMIKIEHLSEHQKRHAIKALAKLKNIDRSFIKGALHLAIEQDREDRKDTRWYRHRFQAQ